MVQKVGDYMTPKLIEVIKNSSTDSRTNETPFVVGETVVGQKSGLNSQDLKLLHPIRPNPTMFNPYTKTCLPTSYSSTTNLSISTLNLAAKAVGPDFYGNIEVGELLVGQTSGARAVVKDRRLLSDRCWSVERFSLYS